MKKTGVLLLCALLLVSLLGCGREAAPEEAKPQLQVGFGRTDITPQESVQLRGYFSNGNRWSKEVLDPLYASCVAFTDAEGSTVLVFHLDLISPVGGKIPFARKAVADAVGLPVDNVMLSCTHTHSAPDTASEHPTMERYCAYLQEQLVAAAQAAMADRKPAEMFTATTELEKMNFVRHYVTNDGSAVGDNFGDLTGKTITGHMRESDKQMQLVRFKREGGKDVMLVNFQVHPHRTGDTYAGNVSADIVGAMRSYVEPRMDCYMAYFTGASGDLNPTSRLAEENIATDYIEQGSIMGQEALLATDNMTPRATGKVQILRKDVQTKSEGVSVKFTTYALSLGDLAFVFAPYEMFDTNGMFIKENSPYAMTFVATCSNATNHYVAAEWAYYEDVVAYEVGNGNYEKGTAEMLADSYVEMLTQLHPNR